MARVTDCEVKEIFDTTIDTTPFITTANLIVTEVLAAEGLSAARLKQIELYLAAHFACVRDPQLKSEKAGDASNEYQGTFGSGLDSTRYGQQVKLLDSSGKLVSLELKKAKFETLRTQITPKIPGGYWY